MTLFLLKCIALTTAVYNTIRTVYFAQSRTASRELSVCRKNINTMLRYELMISWLIFPVSFSLGYNDTLIATIYTNNIPLMKKEKKKY